MLKSLLMASALTMAFSGAAMADDAPSAGSAGCTGCIAPIGNETAPTKLAQVRTTRNLGPAQQVEGPRGINGVPVTDSINTCCAPIAGQKEKFGPMFRLQQSAGKNITQTYGVTFMPTTELDNQMKSFAPFVSLQIPSGLHPNSVHLHAEMRQLTEAPTIDVNSSHFSGTDPLVYSHSLRAWWVPPVGSLTPSGVWNGPHAGPPAYVWEKQFEDNRPNVAPNHMAPDKWYMIKLTWKVAMKNRPDDQSWIVKDLNCANAKPIYVRFLVRGGSVFKTAGGAQPSAVSAGEVSIVN